MNSTNLFLRVYGKIVGICMTVVLAVVFFVLLLVFKEDKSEYFLDASSASSVVDNVKENSSEVTSSSSLLMSNNSSNQGVSNSSSVSNTVSSIINNFTNNVTKMPLVVTVSKLSNGDVLDIEENCLKKNKELSFTADISLMDTMILRHGKDSFGASYVSINNKTIDVYYYGSSNKLVKSVEHGLSINGKVECLLVVNNANQLSIKLVAGGHTFTVNKVYWGGTKGKIQLESINTEMTNVKLTWQSNDYKNDIWVFGDSYVEINNTRWPYYIISQSDKFLLSGYGGATTAAMYNDWKTALTHETPKYAVWCLGMNDADSETAINSSWKTSTEKFIADCKAKGIIPILTTIPNIPSRNHTYKNEYIKNSGYRYIDFAKALGATEKGSGWYSDMLSTDNIHPSQSGAQAMEKQIKIDFPEILK